MFAFSKKTPQAKKKDARGFLHPTTEGNSVPNTVLIIDDDAFYQNVLKHIVEDLGFTAEICGDGDVAIRYAKAHHHELTAVLLDIYMPAVDGISVLGHFRATYPQLPVVVITGSDDSDDERVIAGIGSAGIIKKPLVLDTIHETLRTLLPQR